MLGRRSVHSLRLLGLPVASVSRLARRLTTILPAMSLTAARETTRLHRVALYRGECQPTLMSAGDGDETEAMMGWC